jgi:thiamine transport system ATP-binding protein
MSGAAVSLDGVTFRYRDGESEMAMNFDLSVEAGSSLAVIGPSGAGKSTLLSLIAGFDRPASGRIGIGGQDVTATEPSARPVSMVFQDNNLFTHLDVWTNVALGLSPRLALSDFERAAVVTALDRVGLGGYEPRLPGQLSGGERQRVALARALVRNRPVLLLDEPFAALGPAQRKQMLGLLAGLQRETGMTLLIVTHQPDDARGLASQTAFLDAGRIAAVRPTEALLSARDIPALTEYLG